MNQTIKAINNSSDVNIGSGRSRLLHLLQVMFKIICSGGQPVLICVEDLQCADDFTIDIISDFIIKTAGYSSELSVQEKSSIDGQVGCCLVGSFRDDEVPEDAYLMNKINLLEQSQGNVNVTRLSVAELSEQDINEMICFKLCLPLRHTRQLAQLVFCKTRGLAIFVTQFLRLLIQRDFISFSVSLRRWTWDCDTIDMQMISDDVAEFLMKKLKQLPEQIIESLKVASCIGCYVNMSTIQLLDLGQFVPADCLLRSFESAVKEGMMEKAGPMFAFTHDMLREATYNLLPADERKSLHKKIGTNIVVRDIGNTELVTLAADQISLCKDILDPTERSFFARIFLSAGKHSMSTKKSNYEQACGYFESGISLLSDNHWGTQYSLSLPLYEWSVAVCFMHGKVEAVSSRLVDIISNARSFDDSLNSRVLMAKFLASQGRYSDAATGVLTVLSKLGENFPNEINASLVISEVKAMAPMLKGITKDKVQNLPPMTAKTKMHAMKFMDLLATFSNAFSPMLMHFVSIRMTKMTFLYGFCDECISGLVVMSHAILHYSDYVWLATKISRIASQIIESHKNSHSLKARLARTILSVLCFVEPFQAVLERFIDAHHSAVIVGDIDNAMDCELIYCGGSLFSTDGLLNKQTMLCRLLNHMAKHKRISALHSSMSYFNAYAALVGGNKGSCGIDAGIQMMTNDELYQIADETQSSHLLYLVILTQILVHCHFREYLPCAILAEKHQIKHKAKRTYDFLMIFFTGIAALNLARDTKQDKWKRIGEKSVRTLTRLGEYSTWNFENKRMLLQAELYYLNGRNDMAELTYQSSIRSAREHRFFLEEALAFELFGIYFLETKKVDEGMKQLQLACGKYKQGGALKKSEAVKDFMVVVRQVHSRMIK